MSLNTVKAILILNVKKGVRQKGWTDEARAKAAMTRKAKAKKKSGGSGGGARSGAAPVKSKNKLDFYEARRQAGKGRRLIEDQVKRAYDYRETSTELYKTDPKKSEKFLKAADNLDGMIERNEKRLKKLIKRYRIDRNPY